MTASKVRVIVFNSILLLFSLIIAAFIAEAAVRVVAPQQLIMIRPDLWEAADTVGWLRRPNVDAELNAGEGTVRLISDQDGFRVGKAGRTTGLPVLLIGDSFVEALQVEYEESVGGLLEQSLTNAIGTRVAVRNAGIGGWNPSQYYLRARALMPREQYRLVITAIYVGNDVRPERTDYVEPRTPAERHHFRMLRGFSKAEFLSSILMPLNDALEVRSHLWIMVRSRLETLRMKMGMSPLYFPREFLKSEAESPAWSLTADVCQDIKELAEAHDARALFVLIPTDYQVNPNKFNNYVRGFGIDTAAVDLDQPTHRLLEEFNRRDLSVVDALPRFREVQAGGTNLYGTVDQHLSAAGHKVLTELIAPVAATMIINE